MDTSNHHNKVEARPADSIVSAVKVKTFTDSMNEHCGRDVMVAADAKMEKCINGVDVEMENCNNGMETRSASAIQPGQSENPTECE